ncbi:helix-turn-helix domain-containing protein [Pendulispora brunnea]|uniref:Helix-turn-helix domain-containing protein n=1 Tax=Pendulispora brunnea TaxID=2905690 RepID=A0ABZ2K1K0_9BACT
MSGFTLRQLRERARKSQAEVARGARMHQSDVSALENRDLRTTRLETLERYARAVGGELEVVLVENGQRTPIRLDGSPRQGMAFGGLEGQCFVAEDFDAALDDFEGYT